MSVVCCAAAAAAGGHNRRRGGLLCGRALPQRAGGETGEGDVHPRTAECEHDQDDRGQRH